MNSLKILDVFIGNQCNLTCIQCDTRSDVFRTKKHDPEIENIKQGIILAREKFVIQNYSLLGGEPLLYLNKVEEIIKFIRSIDPTAVIMLPTNGTLIDRHVTRLFEIIEKYQVLLVVCDHFSGFDDQTHSVELKGKVQKLLDTLQYKETTPFDMFNKILDWKNTANDPLWELFLESRGNLDPYSNDRLFLKNKSGVFFKSQDTFDSHYYHNDQGTPKPFDSLNFESSYTNGCCSPFCTFMIDKKLYKCAALGTLKKFLTHNNLLTDPDWQKYLQYKPVDLENCTDAEISNFSNTKYRGINECTMCPATSDKKYKKTPEKVFPIKIKNVQHS